MNKEDTDIIMEDTTMSAVKAYRRIYSINEAAEVLKVHQQTLRNWERHQLIVPMRAAQRRIYTEKDVSMPEIPGAPFCLSSWECGA